MGVKRSRIRLSYKDYRNLCQKVYHRDNWKCRVCKKRKGLAAHHIIFRSHGGDDADWNLLSLCQHCHDGIHKPHPRTGAMVVLLPQVEGELIDANKPIKFFFVNGWKPK